MKTSAVKVTELTKRFDRSILENLSFELGAGTFTALVGASGSGKSTLLHILGGLDTPDSGIVSLFGGPSLAGLSDTERSALRLREIGIIFQFFQLLPALSAEQNAKLPAQLLGEEGDSRVRMLFERFGLEQRRRAFPYELSGGELQRVALIRALCNSPQLLLADEPTGNLDSKSGDLVMDTFRRVVDEDGVTLFVVTHDRKLAERADRILELVDGRLQER